jgi:hypothetical protein
LGIVGMGKVQLIFPSSMPLQILSRLWLWLPEGSTIEQETCDCPAEAT